METKHLKKYAPEARRDFIAAVKNKAAVYGLLPKEILPMKEEGDVVIIGDRPFPRSVAKQRKELEARIRKEGFQQFIEAISYTWFNRFVAIRYMELHGYLDHGYRVLSHPEGKATPEILENAERVELPGLKRDEVVDLKLDGGKDEQLYQMLLLAQCNALHKAMPFLFESIKDGTELLLPDNLLHTDSLVRTLVNDIPEEQWESVEIIGWLYQFYISEKKDEVIGKVVKSEDIPAATQLFTPNWIVRYMLHNTLGRKWLATYPDSPLRNQMEFYIEPAEQTPDVQQTLKDITPDSLNPEELTLLDPACGSGHILVEAYDLFKAIYEERGYRGRDIPKLILTKNLFGLEIDDRAAQLAAFALMMKARADDRMLFNHNMRMSILSMQSSNGLNTTEIVNSLNAPLRTSKVSQTNDPFDTNADDKPNDSPSPTKGCISQNDVSRILDLFEQATTLGSLIRIPSDLGAQLTDISQRVNDVIQYGGLFEQAAAKSLQPFLEQAGLLALRYSTVVANPPYMGGKAMCASLKQYAQSHFPDGKADLFAMFIERCLRFTCEDGTAGLVTPFTWMFLSSFSSLRSHLIEAKTITTLVQLEYNAFEPACIPVCTFVLQNRHLPDFTSTFIKLSDFKGHETQAPRTLEAIRDPACSWRYHSKPDSFANIPGSPVAFWLSEDVRTLFQDQPPLGDLVRATVGLQTSDNDRFLRMWYEVSRSNVCLPSDFPTEERRQRKWMPHNKGGSFRKWWGNQEYVANWANDGAEIRAFEKSVVGNTRFYFMQAVSWSDLTSSANAFRLYPDGFLFDNCAPCVFADNGISEYQLLALLNTSVMTWIAQLLNPTMHFRIGYFNALPGAIPPKTHCESNVARLVELCRIDWNLSETSWEFERPLIIRLEQPTLAEGWRCTYSEYHDIATEVQRRESDNNQSFLDHFAIGDGFSGGIPLEQIALICNPVARYGAGKCEDEYETLTRMDVVRGVVSFAVGCMMGRYSLDELGLIYAHGRNEGFDPRKYTTFPADDDGIIPVTDMAWFPDDVAFRFEQFIKTVWPEEHLEENLKFVAKCLDQKKGETSRDCIRRYLATAFYKQHLSMYKKRPIYWLFSSGKQRAFQCLVYLHRYNAGTLSRMRTEYVVKLQGKINARIEQLESGINSAGSTSHRKKLEKERDKLVKQREELQEFDEKLRYLADQRIELDLDDGVKGNYGKFGDLLAEVKTVTGGISE